MYGIQEEMARSRMQSMREEAAHSGRVARIAAARRWQRRAESASRRARAARDAVR